MKEKKRFFLLVMKEYFEHSMLWIRLIQRHLYRVDHLNYSPKLLDWLENQKFCFHLPGKYPKPKYICIACQFWITNCIVQYYLFYKLCPCHLPFPWAKENCQAANSYFTTHKGMGIPQALVPGCLSFLNFYWLGRLYQGVQLRVLNCINFFTWL